MTLDTVFSILSEMPSETSLLHLLQHTKGANYQALVWKQALNPVQDLPPPDEHGWMCTDDILTPVLMTKDPAQIGLVEMALCICKKSLCSMRDVAFKKNKLPCTKAFAYMAGEDCQNPKTHYSFFNNKLCVHIVKSSEECGTLHVLFWSIIYSDLLNFHKTICMYIEMLEKSYMNYWIHW